MKAIEKHRKPTRVLLSGVFGPFGVDDAFGRKENIMELFHNQVTRGQDLASFRFHHRSFGLYFLASNIDADVTVLDFPSRRRFAREVAKGYDVVGISFITPNFAKAKEMVKITRRAAPRATIIAGGHGAAIEGVKELLGCDHVVRGEGIRWLREFLGQDPDAPIHHPTLPSSERSQIFGVPLPGKAAGLLVPGVGCVNACKFCCTSHFFGRSYSSFLSSGRQLFETACRIGDERGTDELFVMDENFLKDRQRALDFADEMERHGRYFSLSIFSSAEAILAFGLDNMERLGVTFTWIGVESRSRRGNYEKNAGVNAKKLIADLRARGIIVLASGILCAEHHTRENIQDEIDFMIQLEADFVQFMLLTALPVTKLYESQRARGSLREDLPFEEWHGQKELVYRHPEFPGDSAKRWIDHAFRQEYEVNSSSMLRVTQTVFRGYGRLAAKEQLDAGQRNRKRLLEHCTRKWSLLLPTIIELAVNDTERERAAQLLEQIRAALPPTWTERAAKHLLLPVALAWKLRVRLFGDGIQPATICTRYPSGRRVGVAAADWKKKGEAGGERQEPRAAARIRLEMPLGGRAD